MSATNKATMMHIKKYFYPNDSAAVFNENWKKLEAKDKEEMQDLLGTEIESGRWVPA